MVFLQHKQKIILSTPDWKAVPRLDLFFTSHPIPIIRHTPICILFTSVAIPFSLLFRASLHFDFYPWFQYPLQSISNCSENILSMKLKIMKMSYIVIILIFLLNYGDSITSPHSPPIAWVNFCIVPYTILHPWKKR